MGSTYLCSGIVAWHFLQKSERNEGAFMSNKLFSASK